MSVLGIGLGMMQGHQNERRNYRNERNLANQQYGNQRMLNQQGHDLQMDMWNKTNYGAQVGHMKDAGLNPALMYGSAGQGGTTGSQGGGSASKGSSQMNKGVDPNAMLLKAQIEGIKAKANSDNASAEASRGYQADESGSRTNVNKQSVIESIARTSNINEDSKLKAQKKLESISQEELNNTKQGLEQLKLDKGLTGNALIDGFKTLGLDPIGNEEDMYIARGMVALWLGKDYVKMLTGAGRKFKQM